MNNNCNGILCNRLSDFQSDLRSQRNVDREYEEQYGIWRKFIEAMMEDASQNAIRIHYTKFREEDGIIFFYLEEQLLENTFTQETVLEAVFNPNNAAK